MTIRSIFCAGLTVGASLAFAEGGLYRVIDLSAGKDAKSYPVSYLDKVPEGGWGEEYKTTKLVMRRIDAGSFTMGSPTDEIGHNLSEVLHKVTISKSFYIGVFEVTQKQWELVTGNSPSIHKYGLNQFFTGDDGQKKDAQPARVSYGQHPVECVSYEQMRGKNEGAKWPASDGVDADSFIGKLRARTGLTDLDLPTEAQWEYACRAGTTTAFNNGMTLTNDTIDASANLVARNYHNTSDGKSADGSIKHAIVGSYLPNAWGLYDMHGNVFEMCLDRYGPYAKGDLTDPKGDAEGEYRVIRGGGWFDKFVRYCRAGFRHWVRIDERGWMYGFRLATR